MAEAPSFVVTIYIAGDIADARRICREFCMAEGFCVTVTPTDYVYTGGMEAGVIVGCINYPRFPTTVDALTDKATRLAEALKVGLCQHSYTISGPSITTWRSDRA